MNITSRAYMYVNRLPAFTVYGSGPSRDGRVVLLTGPERGGQGAGVGRGDAAGEPAQEPLHQHPAVRPLARQAAAVRGRGGLRLHQRQLDARESARLTTQRLCSVICAAPAAAGCDVFTSQQFLNPCDHKSIKSLMDRFIRIFCYPSRPP